MPIKNYKPNTPGTRGMSTLVNTEITTRKPEKSLLVKNSKKGGRNNQGKITVRNNQGKITVRHHGGGEKRKYRLIDFKRNKDGITGVVATIEYDPNRSANIALINYADGEKRYIIAPKGLKVGDTVVAGTATTFYTQVNMNAPESNAYDYRVEGWVINGTEFVPAKNLGNGLYSNSYVFTEDVNTVIPVYFHTQQWLDNAGVKTVTVYAVADKGIENWDTYLAAYTWYKPSGTNVYEQFGKYSGQVMIPVAGLNGVYYTYVEYGTEDKIQISGITFNNYANGDGYDVVVNDYTNIQTYDYYEFVSLLDDGKENITFVLKDTNDKYNSNQVAENTNETLSNFNFVQFTDYSGLKTDIFGNDIEDIDATLSDSNALYIIQAGDKAYNTNILNGSWYVDCFLYDATGKYLGMCHSYELHDEDAAIWSTLTAYENQRAYISYEHVNGNRFAHEPRSLSERFEIQVIFFNCGFLHPGPDTSWGSPQPGRLRSACGRGCSPSFLKTGPLPGRSAGRRTC